MVMFVYGCARWRLIILHVLHGIKAEEFVIHKNLLIGLLYVLWKCQEHLGKLQVTQINSCALTFITYWRYCENLWRRCYHRVRVLSVCATEVIFPLRSSLQSVISMLCSRSRVPRRWLSPSVGRWSLPIAVQFQWYAEAACATNT